MKRLLFAALFATVALGGAYAQYKDSPDSEIEFDCNGAVNPRCTFPVYDASTGQQVPLGSPVYTRTRI